MLYAFLLDADPGGCSLPELAQRRFDLKLGPALEQQADCTFELYEKLSPEIDARGLRQLYETMDLPLTGVLARMEKAGVAIDRAALSRMSSRLESEIDVKAKEIYDCCGSEFNINSPKQLGDVLFNRLNLPKPVKYGKGKTISTAVDVLEELAANHKAPKLVLEYRQLSKLKSTYVDALPALLSRNTGRLHTTFDQTGTATGRLSSANPRRRKLQGADRRNDRRSDRSSSRHVFGQELRHRNIRQMGRGTSHLRAGGQAVRALGHRLRRGRHFRMRRRIEHGQLAARDKFLGSANAGLCRDHLVAGPQRRHLSY